MEEVLTKFYTAFQELDAETMVSCYHDEVVFQDPAFDVLKEDRAKNMWRMLCENAFNLKIKFEILQADKTKGKVNWEAHYTFHRTGRKVHNIVQANFEFKNGKIIKHTDHFDLHRWSKQALGLKGFLLGGTAFFKNKFNNQTARLLDNYEKNNL